MLRIPRLAAEDAARRQTEFAEKRVITWGAASSPTGRSPSLGLPVHLFQPASSDVDLRDYCHIMPLHLSPQRLSIVIQPVLLARVSPGTLDGVQDQSRITRYVGRACPTSALPRGMRTPASRRTRLADCLEGACSSAQSEKGSTVLCYIGTLSTVASAPPAPSNRHGPKTPGTKVPPRAIGLFSESASPSV